MGGGSILGRLANLGWVREGHVPPPTEGGSSIGIYSFASIAYFQVFKLISESDLATFCTMHVCQWINTGKCSGLDPYIF